MWKMNFIYHFLFEIYEFKNIIFSPLSIPNHAHMIWYYQVEEIFEFYLYALNELISFLR